MDVYIIKGRGAVSLYYYLDYGKGYTEEFSDSSKGYYLAAELIAEVSLLAILTTVSNRYKLRCLFFRGTVMVLNGLYGLLLYSIAHCVS